MAVGGRAAGRLAGRMALGLVAPRPLARAQRIRANAVQSQRRTVPASDMVAALPIGCVHILMVHSWWYSLFPRCPLPPLLCVLAGCLLVVAPLPASSLPPSLSASGAKKDLHNLMARVLKKEFDLAYGGVWHCIVGRNFGSLVTHTSRTFIYFYIGQVAVLMFKAGSQAL